MKKWIMTLSALFLVFLAACSNSAETKNDKTESKQTVKSGSESNNSDLNKAIVVNGLELTVKQNKSSEMKKGEQTKKLYSFTVKGKNVGNTKSGLGSIDFVLKTKDNKEIQIDDSLENFGNEISKGKAISGPVYFSVAEKLNVQKIEYKPEDKVLASWEVK